jgi:hypothetical protein
VELPASLYYQLGLLDKEGHSGPHHVFLTGFTSDALYPQITVTTVAASESAEEMAAVDYLVVSAVVLGASLPALEPFNLSEPVYVVLQKKAGLTAGGAVPAWWDPRGRRGLGAWSPAHCRLLKERREWVVFSCNRLGSYALLQQRPGPDVRYGTAS